MRNRIVLLAPVLVAVLMAMGCEKRTADSDAPGSGAGSAGTMGAPDPRSATAGRAASDRRSRRRAAGTARASRFARGARAEGTLAPKTLALKRHRIRVAVPAGWDERIKTDILGMAKYQKGSRIYDWLESCEGDCLVKDRSKNVKASAKRMIKAWKEMWYVPEVKANRPLDAGRWEVHVVARPSDKARKAASYHVPLLQYRVYHFDPGRETIFRCNIRMPVKGSSEVFAKLKRACQELTVLGPRKAKQE